MRGSDTRQGSLFSYVNLDNRIPAKHPIRKLRLVVDIILSTMDAEFSSRYADTGRPSIPPEQLLRALLLQVMHTQNGVRHDITALRPLIFWYLATSGVHAGEPAAPNL